MRNEVLLKIIWYMLCENPFYDFREWGVGLQINHI